MLACLLIDLYITTRRMNVGNLLLCFRLHQNNALFFVYRLFLHMLPVRYAICARLATTWTACTLVACVFNLFRRAATRKSIFPRHLGLHTRQAQAAPHDNTKKKREGKKTRSSPFPFFSLSDSVEQSVTHHFVIWPLPHCATTCTVYNPLHVLV